MWCIMLAFDYFALAQANVMAAMFKIYNHYVKGHISESCASAAPASLIIQPGAGFTSPEAQIDLLVTCEFCNQFSSAVVLVCGTRR